MVEVTQEAIEEAAPLLDNALGFPCSEAQAERILEALSPMITRHRQAGVQQGLDMAAGVADGYRMKIIGIPSACIDDTAEGIARAIRKLGGDDGTD